MKNFKKYTSILLVVVLILSLCACSKTDKLNVDMTNATIAEAETGLSWLTYHLAQEEIRIKDDRDEPNESSLFPLPDMPAGQQCVIVKLVDIDGKKILTSDIEKNKENWSTLHLKAPSGEEYEPLQCSYWGISIDLEGGTLISNESQNYFQLYYFVPEGTALSDLTLFVKDVG